MKLGISVRVCYGKMIFRVGHQILVMEIVEDV